MFIKCRNGCMKVIVFYIVYYNLKSVDHKKHNMEKTLSAIKSANIPPEITKIVIRRSVCDPFPLEDFTFIHLQGIYDIDVVGYDSNDDIIYIKSYGPWQQTKMRIVYDKYHSKNNYELYDSLFAGIQMAYIDDYPKNHNIESISRFGWQIYFKINDVDIIVEY